MEPTEDKSVRILAQTLLEMGGLLREAQSELESAKYWKRSDEEKIAKLEKENKSANLKLKELEGRYINESSKAIAARTFIKVLIEKKKLKGKDLKEAKAELTTANHWLKDLLPKVDLNN